MPIFEFACPNAECAAYAQRVERLLRRFDEPDPACESCGGATKRLISRPRLVWLRDLVAYDNPNAETARKDQERGFHTVACKRSFGGTPDKPVFKQIRTRKEQVDYVKAEGLIDPAEIGNVEVHKDGVGMSSQGMPGSWS